MCGIFAVIEDKNNQAGRTVQLGLKRLEYRGYDSWGIALLAKKIKSKGGILMVKQVGEISRAKIRLPASSMAIGHTRWATHGAVTNVNAHPHFSTDKSFCLAQNGIVENYFDLKEELKTKGYKFETQTDTEVIVRLIELELKQTKNLAQAIRKAFVKITGRNTIIVLSDKKEIIALRNGSPLVVGRNKKTYYFSSDVLSFAGLANDLLVVDNGQMARWENKELTVADFKTGKKIKAKWEKMTTVHKNINSGGFDHFMIKEIFDIPDALKQILLTSEKEFQNLAGAVKKARQVYTIGSGTTGMAAAQIAFYLRSIAETPAISLVGAEASEYSQLFNKRDLLIAPSQSGETADVLEVLEIAQNKGAKIASCVNMPGSMMTRMSDFRFMVNAGPEICVVSTKVFVSHLVWGYLLAKTIGGKYRDGVNRVRELVGAIDGYLADKKEHKLMKQLANKLISKRDIFLLAKGQNLNIVKEGMVKIIETTYKHAHAIAAGDLKHYAITIMDKGVPVIFAISDDQVSGDVINSLGEVKARGAEAIVISSERINTEDDFIAVPRVEELSAIMNLIPLQLLAYYLALELGNPIDKPRNIAKSVTVK